MKPFIVVLISISVVLAGLAVGTLLVHRFPTAGDIIASVVYALAATVVFLASRKARRNRQ